MGDGRFYTPLEPKESEESKKRREKLRAIFEEALKKARKEKEES